MNIDSLNWKILSCLQNNARQSNAQIGREVGITSPAVAERIRKMEDAGLIKGYGANISPIEAGYQFTAIVTLRAFMGKLKPFLQMVPNFKEVVNCYRITGTKTL